MGATLTSPTTSVDAAARPLGRGATASLRVLVVEPHADRASIAHMLGARAATAYDVEVRSSYRGALAAIRQHRHDVYLIDARLGEHSGLELVAEGFAARPPAPVILLTGASGEAPGLESAGLQIADQLVKDDLSPAALERSIHYALSHHRAIAELARSEERYSLAIRAANDGIWDWDLIAGTLYLSPRWHAILGRPQSESDGDPARSLEFVHPADAGAVRAAVRSHLEGRTPHLLVEHRMRHADGSWRWVVTRGLAIRGAGGRPTRMAGSMSDVTDRRAAVLRLQHDALHDSLTGLPNRTLFIDRVHHNIQRSRRDHRAGCAVLFIDVDRFKLVNDSLGHAVGDRLLVALAARLETSLRPGDTVARLGGDEFVVLLEDLVDPGDADLVIKRILASLDEPFAIDDHELFASVSIGIALSTPEIDAPGLIANADIAMYHAKRRGRGRSARFDAGMRRRRCTRLAHENELRQVIEAATLEIHYQPIIELATGAIRGMEALARWPHDRDQVAPSEFITIAEDTGIIAALGQQVLRGALAALAGWRRDRLVGDDVCMSVNLSGRQLDDPGLATKVRAAIEQASVPPEALKLEITESTLVAGMERTERVFAEVCASGVGLHLDDFGTGYSSLSALHRFPVDALKIDRSFVAELRGEDASNDIIVRSTVAMAHSLGLPVIAEGIESVEQLRGVHALGCDFGQGHLFSRAISAREMGALLRRWRPQDIVALVAR